MIVEVAAAVEEEVKPKAAPSVYSGIVLTDEQSRAVEMADRLKENEIAVLTGYAGTGKTTIIKHIAESIGGVTILAPTGKAAVRVRESTGLNAQTIHKWLYYPVEDEDTGFVEFRLKAMDQIEIPPSGRIIIDESSMVGRSTWNDIQRVGRYFGCSIICVGDPFQLPPVSDDAEPFSILGPDFLADHRTQLNEVHRQAQENPIIRASMMIRNGQAREALKLFWHLPEGELAKYADWVGSHDGVVICHRNVTRHRFNTMVRQQRNYSGGLHEGEPILVLKNCYPIYRFNGEVGVFKGWEKKTSEPVEVAWEKLPYKVKTHIGVAKFDDERVIIVEEAVKGMMDDFPIKVQNRRARIESSKFNIEDIRDVPILQANLGYALTCHKSQGSEWEHVLVYVDRTISLGDEDGRRWLYTAVTRAKKHVAVFLE
jgi:exodeoxyribonuclease-5